LVKLIGSQLLDFINFLYKDEEEEKKQHDISDKKPLRTRIMFFDLGILRSS